ncbi:Isochorismatase-like protein [Xylaria arbuscula]|nr:Isochorismatase-like protein [Xylaria arbuscula]
MADPVYLGCSDGFDKGWTYYKKLKLYDVSEGVPLDPAYVFQTTHDELDASIIVDIEETTALVVVDMQNFFLHPRCNDYPEGIAAAKRTLEVVAKCRTLGIRIIWLNWGLTKTDILNMPSAIHRSFSRQLFADYEEGRKATVKRIGSGKEKTTTSGDASEEGQLSDGEGQSRRGLGSNMGSGRGKLLMAKQWNTELYDRLLQASDKEKDIFCDKDRMSGMWSDNTELCQVVKREHFKTLLFADVNSDQCVLGTIVDAYNRGYTCVMLEDCCATKTPGGQDVTTCNVAKCYGFVTDSKSFCKGAVLTGDAKMAWMGRTVDTGEYLDDREL